MLSFACNVLETPVRFFFFFFTIENDNVSCLCFLIYRSSGMFLGVDVFFKQSLKSTGLVNSSGFSTNLSWSAFVVCHCAKTHHRLQAYFQCSSSSPQTCQPLFSKKTTIY